MSKPLVIVGAGDLAQLAHYYFSNDGQAIAAFTVDRAFIENDEFCGLPVIAFEDVADRFSPATHDMFVAVGYSKLNELRKQKYLAGRALGYVMRSYISPKATVLNDGQIGDNCFILEDNTIQPFSQIGNNVTLWSGNHVGHHAVIADHCFISSHVVISGRVRIGEACFIGVNAMLRDHIQVGDRCVIGAGALLLEDAAAEGVYIGNATERSRVPSTRLRKI